MKIRTKRTKNFLRSNRLAVLAAVLAVMVFVLGPLLGLFTLGATVAVGSIGFNQIPTSIRTPFVYAEFDSSKAAQGPAVLAYKALIVGQKTSAGSGTANSIVRVSNIGQVITLAGRGSMLHRQAKAWFDSNKSTELYLGILADNVAGVAATKTLTVTGPATAAGTLHLYIAGQYVPVAVANADVANTIAASINTAIGLALDLPVSGGVSTNVVTLTHRHKGAVGEDTDARLNYQFGQSTPAGVAVAFAAATAGVTNPVLTTLITNMGDLWFNVIAHPYTDGTSLMAIENELSSRFGPMRMIDGVAITSALGSQSALGTLGDGRNSQHSCIVSQAGESPLTPPCEFAAETAALLAYHAAIDPARPFQTLQYTNALPPADADLFTQAERNLILYDGVGTSSVAGGGKVQIERVVTTYQTNASGANDEAYLDANTMFNLMYLRYSFRVRLQNAYPRHKLADDGTKFGSGQPVVTPKVLRGECVAWFQAMEELGLVEGIDQFKRDLIVERNVSNRNRVDVLLPPDLINQLMVTATKIQFLL